MPSKLYDLGNGWRGYYDKSLRLWTGIQYDEDGNPIQQKDTGCEAVYGSTKQDLIIEVTSHGSEKRCSMDFSKVEKLKVKERKNLVGCRCEANPDVNGTAVFSYILVSDDKEYLCVKRCLEKHSFVKIWRSKREMLLTFDPGVEEELKGDEFCAEFDGELAYTFDIEFPDGVEFSDAEHMAHAQPGETEWITTEAAITEIVRRAMYLYDDDYVPDFETVEVLFTKGIIALDATGVTPNLSKLYTLEDKNFKQCVAFIILAGSPIARTRLFDNHLDEFEEGDNDWLCVLWACNARLYACLCSGRCRRADNGSIANPAQPN